LIAELDLYIQAYEPFKLIKTEPEKTKVILWNLAYGALSAGWMLKPFMPDTAEKIFEAFGVQSESREGWQELKVKLEAPLFLRKN
ncbi:MAG: hypothetical protein HYW09_00130, partial [Candidatus Niyogibacteria bacterium]|nr:hypothetical protein [Candidatus Niyogibacteria bacterium]